MPQISKTKKQNVFKKIEDSLLRGESKSYSDYSEELQIHRDTAKKYIEQIIASTPRKSLKEIEFRIEVMYDRVICEAEKMLNASETNDERERAIKLLIHCHEKFQDFLERFMRKPKATEKFEVESRSFSINIGLDSDSMKYVEELESRRK